MAQLLTRFGIIVSLIGSCISTFAQETKDFNYVVLSKQIITRALNAPHFEQFGFRLYSPDNITFSLQGVAIKDNEDIMAAPFILPVKPGTSPLTFTNNFRGVFILTKKMMLDNKIDGTIDLYFSPIQFAHDDDHDFRNFVTYVLYKEIVILDASKIIPVDALAIKPSPPRNVR